MNFVENILNIAKKRGFSNKQLCELLGKNPSYITDWKNGKSKPKADEIILLSDTFNVTPDYLLGYNTEFQEELSEDEKELIQRIKMLSENEVKQVSDYIEFILSKRNKATRTFNIDKTEDLKLVANKPVSVPAIVKDELRHT